MREDRFRSEKVGPLKRFRSEKVGPIKRFSFEKVGPSKQFSSEKVGPIKRFFSEKVEPIKRFSPEKLGPIMQFSSDEGRLIKNYLFIKKIAVFLVVSKTERFRSTVYCNIQARLSSLRALQTLDRLIWRVRNANHYHPCCKHVGQHASQLLYTPLFTSSRLSQIYPTKTYVWWTYLVY